MSHKDLVVVVADALRLRAIRLAEHFKGRVLYFTDSNLASAFESIATRASPHPLFSHERAMKHMIGAWRLPPSDGWVSSQL